jgi:hypothetical protein
MPRTAPTLTALLALPFVLAACGGLAGGPADGAQVTVAFAASGPGASSAIAAAATVDRAQAETLRLEGSNGVLELATVAFVVEEIELDCDDDRVGPCADFETEPAFVELPLGSATVAVTDRRIPAGTYDELEFEIEDLDDDDGRDRSALWAEIRARFPDFPREASMVVEGTFTPTGGAPSAFEVFFDAEVEVELDLRPPLVVDADGLADRTLVVDVQPGRWFLRGDGSVRDLSALDGSLVELEVEIEDGFVEVEFD